MNREQRHAYNSGTLSSSASGGSIMLLSSGALTVAGTGNVNESGGGAAIITVQATGANALAFTGAQTFNAGGSGAVNLDAQATGASITVAAGIAETVAVGGALTVSTPSLKLLGNASDIAASGASKSLLIPVAALTELQLPLHPVALLALSPVPVAIF